MIVVSNRSRAGGLDKVKITEEMGDDWVEAKLGQTHVQFSELHTEYSVRTKNGRSWHTIFKGLFFVKDDKPAAPKKAVENSANTSKAEPNKSGTA